MVDPFEALGLLAGRPSCFELAHLLCDTCSSASSVFMNRTGGTKVAKVPFLGTTRCQFVSFDGQTERPRSRKPAASEGFVIGPLLTGTECRVLASTESYGPTGGDQRGSRFIAHNPAMKAISVK